MTELSLCPNQNHAEKILAALEGVKEEVEPAVKALVEQAAYINKERTENPLASLNATLSTDEINDIAVTYLSNLEQLKERIAKANLVVEGPCPGRRKCAQACIKRTVLIEALNFMREIKDTSKPEKLQN